MTIDEEGPGEASEIFDLVAHAFTKRDHHGRIEAHIVDALRADGALALSLVAREDDGLIGHVAFSPVAIAGASKHWFGLGPVAVSPQRRREGIGSALIRNGLARIRDRGAHGCVVLGAPDYYGRFGFENDPKLHYRDIPPPWLQRIVFTGEAPSGAVHYHAAFNAA